LDWNFVDIGLTVALGPGYHVYTNFYTPHETRITWLAFNDTRVHTVQLGNMDDNGTQNWARGP